MLMLATKYNGHIIKNVNKIILCFIWSFYIFFPGKVFAISNDVLISQVQTESLASASEEFISITNINALPIDITGWRIQYFSAAVTSFSSPSRNILLNGILQPGSTYIAASVGYKTSEANVTFSATLSAAGGHVRLVSGSGVTEQEHDVVGWGTAVKAESLPADLVVKGDSYKRQMQAGNFIDTDNNKNDFSVQKVVNAPDPNTLPLASTLDVYITELLPDPAAPLTDANDEYIEIYNNANTPAVLNGYKLQTGMSYSYSYVFKDEVIMPLSYGVFYSGKTNLILSNTSGKARLLGLKDEVINETAEYSDAKSGSSWQLYESVWSWTTSPSAGTQNSVDYSQTDTAGTNEPSKKKPTTITSSSKSKTIAVKSATSTKSAKQSPTQNSYVAPKSDGLKLPANPLVLAGVGTIAVGYMLYEYRKDLANKFRQFKRNRSASKKSSV